MAKKGKSLRGALQRHEFRKTQEERTKQRELNHEASLKASKISQRGLVKWFNPHRQEALTVFLGEADYGLARACLEENYVGQVIATNYDSEAEIIEKYPDAVPNIDFLRTDARVDALHFGVDATAMQSSNKQFYAQILRYQRENENVEGSDTKIDFVFNFPHLGASIKDQDRNIRAHQQFLTKVFEQVRPLEARLIITLFEGEPYESWQVKALARAAGFKLMQSSAFNWSKYPSYHHCLTAKHGHTSKKQNERKARVYVFIKQKLQEEDK